MLVALTKASIEIFVCVILLRLFNFNYVNAQEPRVMRKTCLLNPDAGPCRASIMMYHFDIKSKSCKKFAWGGCQGNGNRFDSSEECYGSCLKNFTDLGKTRPRYCFLNFDYGFCFGGIPRYYYDPLWKVCKERLYSGCGGNKNNFYNIEQCESICRFGNGFIKSIKMKKGQIRKVIIVNPPGGVTKKLDSRVQTAKLTGAPVPA